MEASRQDGTKINILQAGKSLFARVTSALSSGDLSPRQRLQRRQFLKRATAGAVGLGVGAVLGDGVGSYITQENIQQREPFLDIPISTELMRQFGFIEIPRGEKSASTAPTFPVDTRNFLRFLILQLIGQHKPPQLDIHQVLGEPYVYGGDPVSGSMQEGSGSNLLRVGVNQLFPNPTNAANGFFQIMAFLPGSDTRVFVQTIGDSPMSYGLFSTEDRENAYLFMNSSPGTKTSSAIVVVTKGGKI